MTPIEDLDALAKAKRTWLKNCPPGLFWFKGTLGFKSEYKTRSVPDGIYRVDAYVVESGEWFVGGAKDHDARDRLLVVPIDHRDLLPALRPAAARIKGERR